MVLHVNVSHLTTVKTLQVSILTVASEELHLGSGILIAAPIPEEHAAVGEAIDEATVLALREARCVFHISRLYKYMYVAFVLSGHFEMLAEKLIILLFNLALELMLKFKIESYYI